jgi:hypothetical protein
MSQINKKITEKHTQTAFSKNNSLFYGEIVGEGRAIQGFENTYNVRLYKGNPLVHGQSENEVLKDLPLLTSKSKVLASLEIGDKVLVGHMNSDGGSPYILPIMTMVTAGASYGVPSDGVNLPSLDTSTDVDSYLTGEGGSTGIPNADIAFLRLIQNGAHPTGAVAVLGMLYEETRAINPTIVNGLGATGICQWMGGRLNILQNGGQLNGSTWEKPNNWQTVETQIDYFVFEIKNNWNYVANKISWDELVTGYSSADEVVDATFRLVRYYEIPFADVDTLTEFRNKYGSNTNIGKNWNTAEEKTREWYSMLKDFGMNFERFATGIIEFASDNKGFYVTLVGNAIQYVYSPTEGEIVSIENYSAVDRALYRVMIQMSRAVSDSLGNSYTHLVIENLNFLDDDVENNIKTKVDSGTYIGMGGFYANRDSSKDGSRVLIKIATGDLVNIMSSAETAKLFGAIEQDSWKTNARYN